MPDEYSPNSAFLGAPKKKAEMPKPFGGGYKRPDSEAEAAPVENNIPTKEALPNEFSTNLQSNETTNVERGKSGAIGRHKGVSWAIVNTRINKQLKEQMELYRFVHKMTEREFLEEAIATKLQSPKTTKQQRIEDDTDEALNEEEILIFYHRWTGNRITEGDRRAFDEVSMYHPDVIKSGILTTIWNAAQSPSVSRINSLRYCLEEVHRAAASPLKDSSTRLQYLVSKLREGK